MELSSSDSVNMEEEEEEEEDAAAAAAMRRPRGALLRCAPRCAPARSRLQPSRGEEERPV